MADDDLGPEGFGTRGIPSARKGYDKRVVDTLVAEAVERWAELKRRYDELHLAVEHEGGRQNLARNLRAIGDEVGKILATAGEAADGIRERAKNDAHLALTEATEAVDRIRRESHDDAFIVRKDAWETGTELLELAREAAADIIAEAEDAAMLIRAAAEKEAHRRIAITRKEQDDMLRTARYELDRQVAQARDLAAEMLVAASEEAEDLQPDDTVDERRRQLLAEIERIRAARSIDRVAVLPTEPFPVHDGVGFGELDPQASDLSDALAAEVERLGDGPPPAPASAPPPARARQAVIPSDDDVGTLFEALRTTGELDVFDPGTTDPATLRDRLVIPAHNQGLRETKRRIADLQNAALEAVRRGGWSADPAAIAADLAPALEPAVHKAATAGLEAARAMAGVQRSGVVGSQRVKRLIVTMASDLGAQLRKAAPGDGGPEEVAAAVGRVFRAWRTDDAERWVRVIMDAAYHDELLAALASGGFKVVGVAAGVTCADCPAGLEWDAGAEPPDGRKVPPAHLQCSCTIGPADGS